MLRGGGARRGRGGVRPRRGRAGRNQKREQHHRDRRADPIEWPRWSAVSAHRCRPKRINGGGGRSALRRRLPTASLGWHASPQRCVGVPVVNLHQRNSDGAGKHGSPSGPVSLDTRSRSDSEWVRRRGSWEYGRMEPRTNAPEWLQVVTGEDRPELWGLVQSQRLFDGVWPEYNHHGNHTGRYFGALMAAMRICRCSSSINGAIRSSRVVVRSHSVGMERLRIFRRVSTQRESEPSRSRPLHRRCRPWQPRWTPATSGRP